MLEELNKVADKITDLLLNDGFPNQIRPDYLKEAVLAYPMGGGKRLRPAITMWFCGLFCQNPERALHTAAALEIFHTWTLVHDDIIDKDSTRRGQPTSHTYLADIIREKHQIPMQEAKHCGASMAILTGDLQQAWSFSLLHKAYKTEITADLLIEIQNQISNSLYPKLLSGEAIDVDFEHRNIEDISYYEIIEMLQLKTGELLKFSAQAGAMIGLNASKIKLASVQLAGDFASNAGLAFQLQDDILGVYADTAELGKPVGNDIRERKVTVLIKKALEMACPSDVEFILTNLGNKNLTSEQLEQFRHIIKGCGALEAVQDLAKEYIGKAREALAQLPDNQYRTLLSELADFLITRKH